MDYIYDKLKKAPFSQCVRKSVISEHTLLLTTPWYPANRPGFLK